MKRVTIAGLLPSVFSLRPHSTLRTRPPAATAASLVRVSGNVLADGMPGTVLVGLRVSMHKKDGEWLLRDAEFQEPVRAGW